MRKVLVSTIVLLLVWSGCVEEEMTMDTTTPTTTSTTTEATTIPSICSGIENVSERFACYSTLTSDSLSGARISNISEVAVRFADPDLCELIRDYEMSGHGRFYCFTSVACSLEDPSICDRDLGYSTFFRPQCKEAVAVAKKDPSICEDAQIFKDSCLQKVAEATANAKICEQIKDKDQCYRRLAATTKNFKLCDEIQTNTIYQPIRDVCYRETAEAAKDLNICSKISNQEIKDGCYSLVARATRDPTICDQILDQESRDRCYSVIVTPTKTTKGEFFDENGTFLGNCTVEKNTETYTTQTFFYDLNGTLIGSCSSYQGPGSSGGYKGGCTTDALLGEPTECGGCIIEGLRLPKYYCKTNVD